MVVLLFFGVGLLVVVMLLRGNRTRGWLGEMVVRGILGFLPREYRVVNDVRFNVGRSKCQIDHLVVSPYGIFVIETKNYFGFTSGDSASPMLRRSVLGMRYTTRNPLFQNKRHVDLLYARLHRNLRIDPSDIHSVVVFSFANFLRLTGNRQNVIKYYQLLNYLRRFKAVKLSSQEVDNICSFVLSA